MFALYTGTETAEEKEIIRNIYNGDWDFIPTQIAIQLRKMSRNNSLGEIIKILMITSSGSEGINLRNTRYVHIMEPYWHPVRTEQVIGRARRICSHKDLPPELQTVEVFLYLMTFTEEQKKSEDSIELKLKDLSKREPFVPLTSDEALYEISVIKEEINSQLVRAIKETAIDCAVYAKRSKENLQCLRFGEVGNNTFSYVPNIEKQQDDSISQINKVKMVWKGKEIIIEGVKYIRREMSPTLNNIYDYASYEEALENGGEPRLVGTLVTRPDKTREFIPVLSGFV
jgi:SNF2 family DNA or RNA helicase